MMLRNHTRLLFCTIVTTVLFQCACAGTSRLLAACKVVTKPEIDGQIKDGEWPEAGRAEGFIDLGNGEPATHNTQAWITYSPEAIYVAFRCQHESPESIRARETLPGSSFNQDDHVGITLDPFRTRTGQASSFKVNALGTTSEYLAGGRASKTEWRGQWKGACLRTDDGYVVEMAIPWRMIEHPDGGVRDLGINFFRYCAAENRTYFWSDLGRPTRTDNDGTWTGVEVPKAGRPRPQILGYSSLEARKNPDFTRLGMGVDVKANLSSSLAAVGTLFPDFQNIEQQVEPIGFTRTERNLGDSRPFFAEGSERFQMLSPYGIGRGFYSRRIREVDAGAKVYGQLDSLTRMGALVTLSPENEWNAAGRIERTYGDRSMITGYGTIHKDRTRDETMVGGSGYVRSGNHYVFGHAANLSRAHGSASTVMITTDYEAPHLYSTLVYRSVPNDFQPYLGLMGYTNYTGGFAYTSYSQNPTKGPIESLSWESVVDHDRRFNGKVLSRGFDTALGIGLRSFHTFNIAVESRQYEDTYDRGGSLYYRYSRKDPYNSFSASAGFGSRGPNGYRNLSASINRRPVKGLDLGLAYAEEKYLGHRSQMIGTVGYQLDPKRSVSARIVNRSGNLNSYVAYREAGFAGSEFFAILGDPNAPSFRTRFAVKWVTPLK